MTPAHSRCRRPITIGIYLRLDADMETAARPPCIRPKDELWLELIAFARINGFVPPNCRQGDEASLNAAYRYDASVGCTTAPT